MRRARLARNNFNGDTHFWIVSGCPNVFLTQDRRTLLVLEPYTRDGEVHAVEMVEAEDAEHGTTETSVWEVAWATDLGTLYELCDRVRKQTDEVKNGGGDDE